MKGDKDIIKNNTVHALLNFWDMFRAKLTPSVSLLAFVMRYLDFEFD